MDSSSGLESTDHSESKVYLNISKKNDVANISKILSLFFCGIIGFVALGMFGVFMSLDDPNYYALLSQMQIIGYICSGFALMVILLSLIFKKNMLVFVSFSFLTAIFGSFQFIVFAISPFGLVEGSSCLFNHVQYVITFVLSLIVLILTYLHIIGTKKN